MMSGIFKSTRLKMLLPGSLNRWDRYHIIPQLAVYTTYIPLIVLAYWVIIHITYHLLREPETAIEQTTKFWLPPKKNQDSTIQEDHNQKSLLPPIKLTSPPYGKRNIIFKSALGWDMNLLGFDFANKHEIIQIIPNKSSFILKLLHSQYP